MIGTRPDVLPETELLPRILSGVGDGRLARLDTHWSEHGPPADLGRLTGQSIIDEVERAGLRGHGGASFPTARKLQSVAARRRPKYVVVNATEGEPVSRKDRVLLREAPHLVLDGAAAAARAVGAKEAFVAFAEGVPGTAESLSDAVAERQGRLPHEPRWQLVSTPHTYLSGQETALVNFINTGEVRPLFAHRPFERGVRQRPTLVQNAETLAHLGLIARHGAEWFRQVGTDEDPGSALVTLAGAVERPGVYEIEHGLMLRELVQLAGQTEPVQGLLVGGYFGTWIPGSELGRMRLSPTQLRPYGAALGAGVIVCLGASACPVREIARVAEWYRKESAGQCGTCVHGLDAIADMVGRLATGTAPRGAYQDLRRWSGDLAGRGACQHPDGAVRFMTTGLQVFAEEFDRHARDGGCPRCAARPVLPVSSPARMVA